MIGQAAFCALAMVLLLTWQAAFTKINQRQHQDRDDHAVHAPRGLLGGQHEAALRFVREAGELNEGVPGCEMRVSDRQRLIQATVHVLAHGNGLSGPLREQGKQVRPRRLGRLGLDPCRVGFECEALERWGDRRGGLTLAFGTAANALATGEVDFWDTVPSDMVQFLKQHGITVQNSAVLGCTLMDGNLVMKLAPDGQAKHLFCDTPGLDALVPPQAPAAAVPE